jgi:hypothetical protein
MEKHAVLPLAGKALSQTDPRARSIELQLAHVMGLVQRMMPACLSRWPIAWIVARKRTESSSQPLP